MSDSRFFVVILVVFGAFVIGCVLFLNMVQPAGVDVEIWNRIMTPATTIIGVLIVLINSNANRRGVENKTDDLKHTVEKVEQKADTAAKNAEVAAETASQLSREKR